MAPLERALLAMLLVLPSLLSGCDDEPESEAPPDDTTVTQPASPTAAVRFKGNEVLANDLARGLSLERESICTELGAYSCTDVVHKVTLGGVDPYERQIYEPTRGTTATTPLAAERVVLSACLERAARDFGSDGGPVVFVDMPKDGARLTDPQADSVSRAIDKLYVQLVQRHPSADEVAAVEGLYAEVEATGEATPAQTWATLACFAIGTSTEFLFY